MFTSERNQLRQFMFNAWKKHLEKKPVELLEAQIIDAILLHPEYYDLFSYPEKQEHQDFGEENPFLHLALHLSLREQVNTNRPQGITEIFQMHLQKTNDLHQTEHEMMECLGNFLWQAQKAGTLPDENDYLETLKNL